jgi:hypothetical protein
MMGSTAILRARDYQLIFRQVTSKSAILSTVFTQMERRTVSASFQEACETMTNILAGRMAAVWMSALDQARQANMLQTPEDNGSPDDAPSTTCEKIPGQGDGPHKTQNGYGFDDGPYVHKSTKMGSTTPSIVDVLGTGSGSNNGERNIAFGQILNKGGNPDPQGALDEIIVSIPWVNNNMQLTYYVNIGDLTFEPGLTTFVNINCPSENVQYWDMNGDLLDDFVCIQDNGDLAVASKSRFLMLMHARIC